MIFKKALKWIFAFLTVTAQCVNGRNSNQNASPCDKEASSPDESFYILQPFRTDVESTNNCTDSNKYVNLFGQRSCPYNNRNVSGCPKAFKLNYNPNRIPDTVAEAYCPCKRSLKNGSVTADTCRVLYNYRVVLFKEKGKGKGKKGKKGKKEERTVRRVRAFGVDCVKDEGDAFPSGLPKPED